MESNEPTDIASEPQSPGISTTRLAAGIPLTERQVVEIVGDLFGMVEGSFCPRKEGLILQSLYLTLLLKFLRQYRTSKQAPWDGAPELNDAPLEAFQKRRWETPEEWEWLRKIAKRPVRATRLRGAVTTYARALREITTRGDSRFVGEARGLWAYLAATIRKHPEPTQPNAAGWSDIGGFVIFELSEPEWRKHPWPELRFGLNFMLLRVALAIDLASESCDRGPNGMIGQEQMRKALDRVQAEFGSESGFLEALARYPKLLSLLEGLFERPQFPYAMVGD